MDKHTFYFSHDYNVRNNKKIKPLLKKHGMAGYGIFWAIIEDLYNNANALPLDYEGIAYDLRTGEDIIKSIIEDFELFVISGDSFSSIGVSERINAREEKSLKARESANKRWDKMRSHNEGNANSLNRIAKKERKGKEKKGKMMIEEISSPPPDERKKNKTPSEVLKSQFGEQFGLKAKNWGVPHEKIPEELSKFDNHHLQTAFTDARHILNSWNLWCKNYWENSSKNLKNSNQNGNIIKKPVNKTSEELC